ncbi:SIR2 family NAD-dependent protein deacylase [Leptospira yasudae]|uniref:SIR2 family NAD-dependent protein deacylase n=1 Tax=Leptospira yasudae TaxID=2202201 RepID=UPI00109104E3|nr:SIR2 family protein [Leptospira yasudae]TGM96791.1 SIR2 family protein [Leptospira yasudae]
MNPNLHEFIEIWNNQKDRIVFFIGAGMSQPLFPSWREFLKDFVNSVYNKGKLNYDKSELLQNIEEGKDFLEIAEICAKSIQKSEYREFLEKCFDKDFIESDIPKHYKSLLDLKLKTLITTNYDRIPEIGGHGSYRVYTNLQIGEALRSFEQAKPLVVKLHGDINQSNSIILTDSEYEKIIFNSPDVSNLFSTILGSKTILFIGFSLSDPHLDILLRRVKSINNGISINHYALLPSRSKYEVDKIERKYNLKVISYENKDGSHNEVNDFLLLLSGGMKGSASAKSTHNIYFDIFLTLKENYGNSSCFINLSKDKNISISIFVSAQTRIELQKEILAICKSLKVNIEDDYLISLHLHFPTEPIVKFTDYSPNFLRCDFLFANLKSCFEGKISEKEFWDSISFYSTHDVGTINPIEQKANFNYVGV